MTRQGMRAPSRDTLVPVRRRIRWCTSIAVACRAPVGRTLEVLVRARLARCVLAFVLCHVTNISYYVECAGQWTMLCHPSEERLGRHVERVSSHVASPRDEARRRPRTGGRSRTRLIISSCCTIYILVSACCITRHLRRSMPRLPRLLGRACTCGGGGRSSY